MIRRAIAAGPLVAALGCNPLPQAAPLDAGPALLTDAVFTRLVAGHASVRMKSPSAKLATDGTAIVLERPSGTAQQTPGSPPVSLQAGSLKADLRRGRYALTDVHAADEQGRALHTAGVTGGPDAGQIEMQAPVVMRGPNWELVAAGGALVSVGEGALELLGPVEARAWPSDADAGTTTQPAPASGGPR